MKVLGISCYLHGSLINKCKILKRLYVYNGLVGIKMKVHYLSLRMYMSNVLVGLLYVCNLKLKSRKKGSKRRDSDSQGLVASLNAVVVWWFWDFGIKLLGIFKPPSPGSKEQYKYYYI